MRWGFPMHYLDLMTQASLLDHHVWASPDTWNSALELAAKKKKKTSGGLIFGLICCVGLVVAIAAVVYFLTQKKKKGQ
ncbi:hypothetical protein ACWDOP_26380 [Nocardia sp. NPDC003693]